MPEGFASSVAPLRGHPPPALVIPPVPSDEIRMLAGQPSADQLVGALGTGVFARTNPGWAEWREQKAEANRRRKVFEAEASYFARQAKRMAYAKAIPVGKEPGYIKSLYEWCGTAGLLVAAMVTVASSLNVAAAYVIESGAWSSLIDRPLLALLFVVGVPAAGVGGILVLFNELDTDVGRLRFRIGLAITTLVAWVLWLAGLAALYALQSVIGDSAGRRLPALLTYADGILHAWLLITQLFAEILAGALLKLLSADAHWRSVKLSLVPNPVYDDARQRFLAESRLASDAAAECGSLDDYEREYQQMLDAFIAACRAELGRLKAAAEAAVAAARADFMRPAPTKSSRSLGQVKE